MTYQLSNEYLTVTLESLGAEIISIKAADGLEYMWCGDKKYWGRHAPVLFPIVGKVTDNTYTVDQEAYHLTQHGFARDQEFKVIEQTEDTISFMLSSSLESKEKYPFEFELKLTYRLKGRSVETAYQVINQDEKEMHFSIGAHPAFNCPMAEGESLEDYYIEFEKEEECIRLLTTPEVYLSGETKPFYTKKTPLSRAFFEDDAIILKGLSSKWLSLKSTKHTHSVTVHFDEFPFMGIWSPPAGAPFVCIEPWVGHADYISNPKELSQKPDMVTLAPNQTFEAKFQASFE